MRIELYLLRVWRCGGRAARQGTGRGVHHPAGAIGPVGQAGAWLERNVIDAVWWTCSSHQPGLKS